MAAVFRGTPAELRRKIEQRAEQLIRTELPETIRMQSSDAALTSEIKGRLWGEDAIDRAARDAIKELSRR